MILEPLQSDKQKVTESDKQKVTCKGITHSPLKCKCLGGWVVLVSQQHSWFGQEGGIQVVIGEDVWERRIHS